MPTGNDHSPHIAVIGSGYWGKNLVRNYANLGALKLICDKNEMILETFRSDHQNSVAGLSISPAALRLLEAYDWPGNIRELRNTLIKSSLKCDGSTIEPRHLKGLIDVFATPSELPGQNNEPLPSLIEVERDHIIKALKRTNWNKSTAAKLLSIDRNRLNRRLKKLGINQSAEK